MAMYENLRGAFGLLEKICSEADECGLGDFSEVPIGAIPVYGQMYDLPLAQIVGFLFQTFGLKDELIAASKADDPQRAIVELAENAEPSGDIDEKLIYPTLCAWIVLVRNLESLSLFHLTVNDLVQRISGGDDEALFNAVFVDPCALQSIVVSQRIARASFQEEGEFFEKLSKAIKRSRPTRPREHLDEVRLMLALVDGVESLAPATDADLAQWATDLGLYPVDSDSLQAIRRQRQKRQKVTSHQESVSVTHT
jgi:hypothetical protein